MLINYIKTNKSITLITDSGRPIVLQAEHKKFSRVSELLSAGSLSEALDEADATVSIKTSNSKFKYDHKKAKITIKNDELPQALSNRLLQFINDGLDTAPLEAFWNNLKKNPTQ